MKTRILIPLLALVAVAGCGGGSNSEPPTTGAVFMTDSLDNHDHVWVAVTKVTLINAEGNEVDAYKRDDAHTIDLKNLRDGSGSRYAFVGKVRTDTYTSAKVTLDKDLALFASGSAAGELHEFEGNDGTDVELTFDFGGGVTVSPTSPLTIDFDLANWTDAGTTVTGNPFLKLGTNVAIDAESRQEQVTLHGTVRNLRGTAPNQTFRLDIHDTADVAVQINSSTVVGGTSSLENGDDVRVRGWFSTSANAMIAVSVYEEPENISPMFEGSVSNINVLAGTFMITIDEAEHILPLFTTVNVETDADTAFYNSAGQLVTSTSFFASLTSGTRLVVRGDDYNAQTNTLSVTRIEFGEDS